MNVISEDRKRPLVGALILLVGVALFVLFFFGFIPRLLTGPMKTVRADFVSTGSLHEGEPVRIDGANVGTVRKITVSPGGQGAVVEMALEPSSGALYANAEAAIKWRTLLGASYSVAIDRGSPDAGALGSRIIPRQQTSYQVELDELTGVLRKNARTGMQSTFRELPKAFSDPSQPGEMLDALSGAAPDIATGLDALRGQNPDQDIANLIKNTSKAMDALGSSPRDLNALIANAAVTFTATGNHAADIQSTLSTAASAMPRVRTTLNQLDNTLEITNPLLSRLRSRTGNLSPALAALDPVVRGADRLLSKKAEPLFDSLRPTAESLARTAKAGSSLLADLAPSLDQIDQTILPDLARRSVESNRTTYEMIGPAIAGLNAMAGHYDADSHYVRLYGSGGGRILDALPCRPFLTDPGSDALLQCQKASKAFQTFFGGDANVPKGALPK